MISSALVAVTVVVHAVELSVLLRFMAKEWQALTKSGFWSLTWLIIWLAYCLLLIHLAEIAVWGLFYFWQGLMPDVGTACYFSGITYTTVGYGDLVLPEAWRMLAPFEALTGILMCGLSTGLFFAVVHRLITDLVKEKLSSEPKEPPVIMGIFDKAVDARQLRALKTRIGPVAQTEQYSCWAAAPEWWSKATAGGSPQMTQEDILNLYHPLRDPNGSVSRPHLVMIWGNPTWKGAIPAM